MAFGERLQELRRARGMTQEDFAAQLKVSRQAVSKWERGMSYPDITLIRSICDVLEISSMSCSPGARIRKSAPRRSLRKNICG